VRSSQQQGVQPPFIVIIRGRQTKVPEPDGREHPLLAIGLNRSPENAPMEAVVHREIVRPGPSNWTCEVLVMPPINTIVVQTILLTPFAMRGRNGLATVRANPASILAIGLLGPASYMLALTAIQLSSVSLVAAARESSVVLVALGGAIFFGEKHVVQRVIGAVVVFSGVALLALG
jgi:uncharacterized membrane protein